MHCINRNKDDHAFTQDVVLGTHMCLQFKLLQTKYAKQSF